MARRLQIGNENITPYPIVLEQGFEGLARELRALGSEHRRVCVITDTIVASLYLEAVKTVLTPFVKLFTSHVIESGESHKNLRTVETVYRHLVSCQFDRKDLLIALGGGVVGDLTGFCAATYLRGVEFVQIPTTLLSQVDSSVGGKTGVDFEQYKNIVGAFYHPRLVYMNLDTLRTLPDCQYASGMAEVIKYALIQDGDFFQWIQAHQGQIAGKASEALEYMIAHCCGMKRDIVEQDPTEQGVRSLLNLGHTIGHAVEKLMDFTRLHGECVSIGMVAAGIISRNRGNITDAELLRAKELLAQFGLPVTLKGWGFSGSEIIAATRMDKKMVSGQIRFILQESFCRAYIDTAVTDCEMAEALAELGADGYTTGS